jgi:hypothetical protein
MGDDLAYRRTEIYRLGGALPELIGTFVGSGLIASRPDQEYAEQPNSDT